MLLRVDPASARPLFKQLAAQIRLAVVGGEVRSGERLSAARDLAESLEINQHTVVHAYQVLRDEGLVELRRGRGALITARTTEQYDRLGRAIEEVRHEAARLGLPVSAVAAMIDRSEEHR
jgi:GntR family transcriptional regulator